MTLSLSSDGTITGTIAIPMGTGEITGTYDAATGDISGEIVTEGGDVASFTGRITGSSFTCSVTFGGQIVELKGERTSAAADTDENDAKKGGKEEKAAKVVEIDLEGFERRGMQLPVSAGHFGPLAVNDKGALLYVRLKKKDPPAIMLFDIEGREEGREDGRSGHRRFRDLRRRQEAAHDTRRIGVRSRTLRRGRRARASSPRA